MESALKWGSLLTMNGTTTSPSLSKLIQLSELDSSIARLLARQKQLDEERRAKEESCQKLRRGFEEKTVELSGKKKKYQEEENRIQEENSKLVERRKVLSTFSNYKVQQSAQKEIEASAKQLAMQEEKLIETLEDIEKLEALVKAEEENLLSEEEKLKEFSADAEGETESVIERCSEKEGARSELATSVDASHLALYDLIRKRHAVDPLVVIQQGKCGGCYMQVAPQMMVQIARGSDLVKCRGCGRILYLQEEEGERSAG